MGSSNPQFAGVSPATDTDSAFGSDGGEDRLYGQFPQGVRYNPHHPPHIFEQNRQKTPRNIPYLIHSGPEDEIEWPYLDPASASYIDPETVWGDPPQTPSSFLGIYGE